MSREQRSIALDDIVSPPETYSVSVSCDNCDVTCAVGIVKGTPAPRGQLLVGVPCPNCGCETLRRAAITGFYPKPPAVARPMHGPWADLLRRSYEEAQQEQDNRGYSLGRVGFNAYTTPVAAQHPPSVGHAISAGSPAAAEHNAASLGAMPPGTFDVVLDLPVVEPTDAPGAGFHVNVRNSWGAWGQAPVASAEPMGAPPTTGDQSWWDRIGMAEPAHLRLGQYAQVDQEAQARHNRELAHSMLANGLITKEDAASMLGLDLNQERLALNEHRSMSPTARNG